MTRTTLLSLPAEMRNRVYDLILPDDIHTLADTMRKPALLSTNTQIRHEYSSIFNGSNLIRIDCYYSETDSWAEVRGWQAKQVVLANSIFTDLSDYWSLASARRHCQHYGYGSEAVRRGIVTVQAQAGMRRWQWRMRT